MSRNKYGRARSCTWGLLSVLLAGDLWVAFLEAGAPRYVDSQVDFSFPPRFGCGQNGNTGDFIPSGGYFGLSLKCLFFFF